MNEAIRLTKKGWVIHPLTCPKDPGSSPGKRPLLNSWQKRKKATEAELRQWFEKTDSNVGLVLGRESGVLVIDFDKPDWVDVLFPQEQKILERTLRAGRITGRGHAYFRYTEKIVAQKLRDFGIEVLTSGNQVVVPPSVHREGQKYKWIVPEEADLETFELPELPIAVIERFTLLKSLEAKIRSCRKCFRWVINQSKETMHGKEGRRLMLATATELKAHNVTLDEMNLYARKVYGDEYDPERTAEEWRNVDGKKTWRCNTLRGNFPEIQDQCKACLRMNTEEDNIERTWPVWTLSESDIRAAALRLGLNIEGIDIDVIVHYFRKGFMTLATSWDELFKQAIEQARIEKAAHAQEDSSD